MAFCNGMEALGRNLFNAMRPAQGLSHFQIGLF